MAFNVRVDFIGICTVVPNDFFWDAPTKPKSARILLPDGGDPDNDPPDWKPDPDTTVHKHSAFLRVRGASTRANIGDVPTNNTDPGSAIKLDVVSDVVRYLKFEHVAFHTSTQLPVLSYTWDPLGPTKDESLSLLPQLDDLLACPARVSPAAAEPAPKTDDFTPPVRAVVSFDRGHLSLSRLDEADWEIRSWDGVVSKCRLSSIVSLVFNGVEDFRIDLTPFGGGATEHLFVEAEPDDVAIVTIANLCGSCNVLGWGDPRERELDDDFRLHYNVLDDQTIAHMRMVLKAGAKCPLPNPLDPRPTAGGGGVNCFGSGTPPYP